MEIFFYYYIHLHRARVVCVIQKLYLRCNYYIFFEGNINARKTLDSSHFKLRTPYSI